MKEKYQKPVMFIANMKQTNVICTSVQSIRSESTGLTFGGGGNGPARGRERENVEGDSWGSWDDWGE